MNFWKISYRSANLQTISDVLRSDSALPEGIEVVGIAQNRADIVPDLAVLPWRLFTVMRALLTGLATGGIDIERILLHVLQMHDVTGESQEEQTKILADYLEKMGIMPVPSPSPDAVIYPSPSSIVH